MIINRHNRRKIAKVFNTSEVEANGDKRKLHKLLTQRLTDIEYLALRKAFQQEDMRRAKEVEAADKIGDETDAGVVYTVKAAEEAKTGES